MFTVRVAKLQRSFSRSRCLPRRSHSNLISPKSREGWKVYAATATVAATTSIWLLFKNRIESEALPLPIKPTGQDVQNPAFNLSSLAIVVWGSNKHRMLDSSAESINIKTPTISAALPDTALRDLALHEKHAACVDARGDVYQWGPTFDNVLQPQVTLRGKNISSIALSQSKLIALSNSTGQIYVISAHRENQDMSLKSWFGSPEIAHVILKTDVPLLSGEKFTSISAGSDHMVAITSKGRTFAVPLTLKGNSHGQLGFRKVSIVDTPDLTLKRDVLLNPFASKDPFSQATPFKRDKLLSGTADTPSFETSDISGDSSIHFCTTLHEVPALKDYKVAQVVTGSRSTYVRGADGRVLSWGANEFGQLGLGANVTLPCITVPTEISFPRSPGPGSFSRCTSISAAGETAFFVIQRDNNKHDSSINEVFACGQGQWGGMGNGIFTTAQGTPTRMKAVSGHVEYNERENKFEALAVHDLVASPTGHAILTFDTLTQGGQGAVSGRDLFLWGLNRSYELGLGKRANQAVPITIPGASQIPLMLQSKQSAVKDLQGKQWKRSCTVEQTAVAGFECSLIYWKICS